MIRYFSIVLVLVLAGCDVPSSIYHGSKLSKLWSQAITMEQLPGALHITEQSMHGFVARPLDPVIVLARIPAEAETGERSYWRPSRLPLSQRQVVESVFSQKLLAKGYQAASRMDVLPAYREAQFPPQHGATTPARGFMRGMNMLVVSVSHLELEASTYFRESNYTVGTTYPVGTRVRLQISASMIDSETTSTRWVATASAEVVMVGEPSAESVLERVCHELADRLPEVKSMAN